MNSNFPEFFFPFATFAGLEFPLKPQHPRLFFSRSDVIFLNPHTDIEKKPLLCFPDATPGTGGWNGIAFLGIVHLPGGEKRKKKIPFSGGEAGSELTE